ncbi:hypothetical protein HAZT_HAZT008617 [Hyalella azteca]|uniref:Uncharacterized protein n=1 Tax=Hyalella azteca TaxID=294128 RepID=A0A6A0GSW3_HYAAZ|nr:hypothetical protein HAZT_HAZT008617 [Hyalella azteca]
MSKCARWDKNVMLVLLLRCRRVSVIRGRVVSANGEGIVGVRTSVDKQSSKYGITATRRGGWFDVLVNGGGAVTLQFQRANFLPLTITVPAPWNDIVVLDPVKLTLKSEATKDVSVLGVESLWLNPCLEHDHKLLRPQVVATHLPYTVGGIPQKSVVQESVRIPGSELHLLYHSNTASGYFSRLLLEITPHTVPAALSRVHLKITVEGSVFEKLFEADPNITYTFTWNKRNVYKQKVYGVSLATVSVGYEYLTCQQIVWETQTAKLHGFYMEIADVGGWNLDIHHMYNFESGVLQRGDGSILDLKDFPRLVTPLVGTGSRRPESCHHCSGRAADAQLLTPTALAAAPDGSVYVGDFNLIRRITKDGKIYTVMELSSTQVSYNYHITVSPVDGHVFVSDSEKYKVVRVLSLDDITDPATNYEDVAGNGARCIPGDEHRCGDDGPAILARLYHPKGLAIAPDKTLYIADGPNLRVVTPDNIIHTLIGHHGHKTRWRHLPCSGAVPVTQVDLQWPSSIALSPLDGTLHILDDHVLLQVTKDGSVRVRAGSPLHCQVTTDLQRIGTVTGLAFAPTGNLYIVEEKSSGVHKVLELTPSGQIKPFAGATLQDCGCSAITSCSCDRDKVHISSRLLLRAASGIAVTPDGVVHVADQEALRVYSLSHYLPSDDQNGDYQVANPRTNEIYTFSRHGHHIETRDLITGRILYSFLYSKNTSFGRLSTVTDSSGNKVEFLRDYSSAVSQVENTLGEKFAVEINRLGLMVKFSERSGRRYDFTYNEETGLLTAVTTPGRLTTVYQYDGAGRVVAVIAPTGFRTPISSWISNAESGGGNLLTVGIGTTTAVDDTPTYPAHTLSLTQDRRAYFNHGDVSSAITLAKNGSWHQTLPWGGYYSGVATFSNPLLEMTLATQARLFPSTKQFLTAASQSTTPSLLDISYGVMGDHRGAGRHVETVMLVNRSRVISSRWDGSIRRETLRDGSGEPLLQSSFNTQLKPTILSPGYSMPLVNFTYDRPARKTWARLKEEYEYDSNGLLSSVSTASAAVTRYAFSEAKLPSSITLPSGRSWELKYDTYGGLQAVNTPSGTSHIFSVQASFSSFVFSYTPPGSSHAYRQHLDPEGRLLLTDFPESPGKILYTYTPTNQLEEIVSGDGITQFAYDKDGLLAEAVLEETDLEYKMDYLYNGRLLQEHRIEYSARSSLSNVKFTFEYDDNMRITKMDGRVGGQSIRPHHLSYSPRNGSPSTIGSFLVSKPEVNITTIQDGTAIFTRQLDSHLRVSSTSLNIHNMQVFRQDITYNRDGRIGQVNTFTRNYHTKPYSNSKNYTYDADGQLISVDAKDSWSFAYDANGNMVSLTYSTNTIPMKYDSQDRIVNFGQGVYKYNSRGAISQNAREVSYQYNARGLLIRASRPGRFNIKYLYDHDDRLIARKDNFGNITQFLYQDPRNPDRVTQIYNTRDASLLSLVYDDRGHLIFVQVHLNQYYVATDENGTPIMIFNRYGEVAREIMRSPYGHIIYDSNPYLYLPISYAGGILDSTTELVHMSRGRIYDPLIGLWLSPNWESIPSSVMRPSSLSLYRFNGNDPINIGRPNWSTYERKDWLALLGYDMESLVPTLSRATNSNFKSLESWTTIPHVSVMPIRRGTSPYEEFVKDVPCVYGQIELLREGFLHSTRLGVLTETSLRRDFWPDTHKENMWRVSEDMTQLNRLAGEVNITKPSDEGSEKFMDVKLRTNYAVVHVRYGSSPQQEKKRLLKHAKKMTIRRAWALERELVAAGFSGHVEWTAVEQEELLSRGSVSSYTAMYLHSPETYPQLLDDPTNIRFYKDPSRMRRNSRSHRSRRCRKWWWDGFC